MVLSKGQITGIAVGAAAPIAILAALHAAAGIDGRTVNAYSWVAVRAHFAYFAHKPSTELANDENFKAVSGFVKEWGWKKGTLTATKTSEDGDAAWTWTYEEKNATDVVAEDASEGAKEKVEVEADKKNENVKKNWEAVSLFMEEWNKSHSAASEGTQGVSEQSVQESQDVSASADTQQ